MVMEKTQALKDQVVGDKGIEYWKAKRVRTVQGAALVGVGVLLILFAFALALILVLKDRALTIMTVALPGGALAAGVLVVAWGATFWSSEVVGSVLEDLLPFVKRKDDG